jgi:hypothetical protein
MMSISKNSFCLFEYYNLLTIVTDELISMKHHTID